MDYETREALKRVIQYLWDDEEANYEAREDDGVEQDAHIFPHLIALQAWLDNTKAI